MNNVEFLSKIQDYFGIYQSDNTVELETWTIGGVNMIIVLDASGNLYEQFKSYVKDFDMDEEILLLMNNDDSYRHAFTLGEAVNDFNRFKETLSSTLDELNSVDFSLDR